MAMKNTSKWYVEYKTTTHAGWQGIGGIEARDGKEAIEYAKEHVAIDAYKFKAFHDDEEEN